MFLGLEDGYGVPNIVEIGMYSVSLIGVTGLVDNYVPTYGITGDFDYIPVAVASVFHSVTSVFPRRCSIGYTNYDPIKLYLNSTFNQSPQPP